MLKNKGILKIIAVVAVMVMSIGMLTGCGITDAIRGEKGKEEAYEEPVKNFVEGICEANSEKLLNAFPGFISDNMKEVFSEESLKELLKEAEEDYGANIKMSYKVTNKSDISEEDIKSMQEEINSNFEQQITITKGYKLDVEVTTKGDDKEDKDTDNFEVYEIDGKWYLLDLN